MTILTLINSMLAGGLLGMLGQGIRTAVGLKKVNEDNAAKALSNPGEPQEQFSVSRMLVSLFIGFVAGALGMIVKGYANGKTDNLETEDIITLIAIGYAGADFIEGVFNTYIKKALPAGLPGSGNPNPAPNPDPNPNPAAANVQDDTVADEANFTNTPAQG